MAVYRWIGGLAALVLGVLLALTPALASSLEDGDAESQYQENAWNFVDISMEMAA